MADLLLAILHLQARSICGGGKSDVGCYDISTENLGRTAEVEKEHDRTGSTGSCDCEAFAAFKSIQTEVSFSFAVAEGAKGCETVLKSHLIFYYVFRFYFQ